MSNRPSLTTAQYRERLKQLGKNIIPDEDYIGAEVIIRHRCLDCKEIFELRPHYLLYSKKDCPHCKPSGKYDVTNRKLSKNGNDHSIFISNFNVAHKSLFKILDVDFSQVTTRCKTCKHKFKINRYNTSKIERITCPDCGAFSGIPKQIKSTSKFRSKADIRNMYLAKLLTLAKDLNLDESTESLLHDTVEFALLGLACSEYKVYRKQANAITNWIYLKYYKVIDPKNMRGKHYHLDHIFSIKRGRTHFKKGLLNLKLICHPANLRIISAEENMNKGSRSDHSLKALKNKIATFESIYGKVIFPKDFVYNYRSNRT